ncbi:MAG: UTP--glucose-1-phosphate uridylyltransferase [Proteobacteria bacterium]|nr:UTP--glucose-1-phosphate uridylyltransferase [Pseudomonadota bacterium]
MEIKQALITAAGPSQRRLPLQALVDRDGVSKTALQILLEEAIQAGMDRIVVVVAPGDIPAFTLAAGNLSSRLSFVEQTAPLGYGHAVLSARQALANEPFLLLVGDHLYVSGGAQRCAQQLAQVAQAQNCSVSAVQATHESKLPLYGTVGGRLLAGRPGLYEVTEVIEKPTPTEAEQRLIVPGLRAGNYLCFFGMHVLTPMVMELLAEDVQRAGAHGGVPLTSALARLAQHERYLAVELQGRRYDMGLKYGLLSAQFALALDGQDRDEILSGLVEMLARREI